MSLPPDLRVLVRRLASTDPDDLPRLCPTLVNHVIRCAGPLSAPHELKPKDGSPETSRLIHQLKTSITSLLNGRSPGGRFAAAILVKAVIDVGGWECLRLSGPWVHGLISLVRKPGAAAAKELGIVAVTRIYSLLHDYQTLTREIATPTVGSFVDACLQIIKPPASGKPLRVSTSLVETVVNALAFLIPLYPSTLRPSASQMREAVRGYIAPTSLGDSIVPQTLSRASRRLFITLHHTAPKNGSSEEWTKAFRDLINDCHRTADQVFRAVQESWESSVGYIPQPVSTEGEPASTPSDELPAWSGLIAGSERLIGLLGFVEEYFCCPTKSPVAIPLGNVMDLASRISLLMPPTPGQEDRFQLNPAIGREEKDQLWSVLPDVHDATMELLLSIVRRLGRTAMSLTRDMVDLVVRMFRTARHIPSARKTAFMLAKELLLITGPTLDKLTVDSLGLLIQACCRDQLDAAGYGQEPKQEQAPVTNGTKGAKGKGSVGNADAFLGPQAKSSSAAIGVDPTHLAAAGELLTVLLSHLPQKYLGPESRGLVDRTAILCSNKDAMLASCLYPYKDKNGRYYPSILPFLTRQFPYDQEVEVLRSNLRASRAAVHEVWDPHNGLEALLEEPAEEEPFQGLVNPAEQRRLGGGDERAAEIVIPSFLPNAEPDTVMDRGERSSMTQSAAHSSGLPAETDGASAWEVPPSPLKRKGEELDSGVSKRLEKGKDVGIPLQQAPIPKNIQEDDDSDSDSGGSVQIDMTLDDDDEEDDEDE